MSNFSYTLEELNTMLNQGMDVFQHYYPIATGKQLGRLNSKMISPFREERDPSFSIYLNRNKGTIFFKDHGIDTVGTHWQFVMDLYSLDFKSAVEKVKHDILGLGDNGYVQEVKRLEYRKTPIQNTRVDIFPALRQFNESDLAYWQQSWISLSTLNAFHCSPAAHFEIKKENKTIRILETVDSPIYNFAFPSGRQKMLRPNAEPKFKWTSNLKADEDVFGFDLIPKECEHLFMIGGNRDAMSFYENMKLPVFALASESANLTEELFHFLRSICKHLWVFYDNDQQGYRKAEKFKEEFGLRSLNHLLYPFDVKDHSQLIQENPSAYPEFKKNLLSNINI